MTTGGAAVGDSVGGSIDSKVLSLLSLLAMTVIGTATAVAMMTMAARSSRYHVLLDCVAPSVALVKDAASVVFSEPIFLGSGNYS